MTETEYDDDYATCSRTYATLVDIYNNYDGKHRAERYYRARVIRLVKRRTPS